MINMLIWSEGDFASVLETVDAEGKRTYPYPYFRVSEMKGNCWMLVLNDKDDFDDLEQSLEAEGDIIIMGTYNQDGSQFEWFNKPNRNHTIERYMGKLNDIIEDEVARPPTEAEALETQVNNIFGWGKRILTNIIK